MFSKKDNKIECIKNYNNKINLYLNKLNNFIEDYHKNNDSIFLQKGNSAFGCRDFEAICMPPPYLRTKSDYLPGKQTLYL